MTNIDHAAIEKQARAIMDSFLKEISGIDEEATFGLLRDLEVREPKHAPCDETFRRSFLANAPKTKDDLLIMERKHW